MRKILTLITALTATFAMAQQLPNNGFESGWGDCTPWTSSGSTTKTGTEPTGWHISQVSGIGGLGATTVGKDTIGYNSDKAVLLTNKANSIMATQIVPGYLTLGTPWNTSVLGSKNDGGTFGGVTFDKRPDALSFMYQRTHGADPATVVAYSWIGSTTQVNVPANIVMFGNPKKVDMKNRDRNILGIQTTYGEEITKSADFQLVSSINEKIAGTTEGWTSKLIEFKFEAKKLVPEMFNVIFASGSYFEDANKKDDNLIVDDVKLVYYSRLSDISVAGKTIDGFSPDKYEYTIYTEGDPDDLLFDIKTKVMGYAASKDERGTADNYTIKITNPDGEDIDGKNVHVYTIKVIKGAKPAAKEISGKLDITMMGQSLASGQEAKIVIKPVTDDTVDFTLPNFSLALGGGDPLLLGDINVPGMKVYRDEAAARTYYKGEVKGMSLAGGTLVADVEAYGYITDAGIVNINIPVTWEGTPIGVRFYSEGADLTEDPKVPEALGISSVAATTNSAAVLYNAAGQRVSGAAHGLRIVRRADGSTIKVIK